MRGDLDRGTCEKGASDLAMEESEVVPLLKAQVGRLLNDLKKKDILYREELEKKDLQYREELTRCREDVAKKDILHREDLTRCREELTRCREELEEKDVRHREDLEKKDTRINELVDSLLRR